MIDQLSTPILFLIFNRPENTEKVFSAIREVQPTHLFLAADGPRTHIPNEVALCEAARKIIEKVDWPCEIKTLFREDNLGCRKAVGGAITWFFQHVPEGIVLEDDCVPNADFFTFCTTLLAHYRNDTRVMGICGSNYQFGQQRGPATYYFSNLMAVWGWASWARAWKHFDAELSTFPAFTSENQIANALFDSKSRLFWQTKINDVYIGGNSWAFPWCYSILKSNGLCAIPNKNLVTNIGFGDASTHAWNAQSIFANIPIEKLGEIKHPEFVLPDRAADAYFAKILMKDQFSYLEILRKYRNSLRRAFFDKGSKK